MLEGLQARLRALLVAGFLTAISLLLAFSLWNTWQAQQMAEVTYLQRMASLLIYQLEADPADPEALLASYTREGDLLAVLRDASGELLFQSSTDTPADLIALEAQAGTRTFTQTGPAQQPGVTEQGGYREVTGDGQEAYFVIPARVATHGGGQYSLTLFSLQTPLSALLLRQAPACCAIWLLALWGSLLASRLLLRRAFGPTEEMLQSQKEFVAAASHELKAPLAVLLAKAEGLQGLGAEDPQVQRDLQVIDRECLRLSKLAQDLLLLAASDADRWTVQPKPVEVDGLLIGLYEAHEGVCRQKSVTLALDLGEERYPPLCTDGGRLAQILGIFLDNALQYAPPGSTIALATRQSTKALTFLVIDHGRGVDDQDKPFLFRRFYRADKARTDKTHFGLGLSIAQELAKILGGQVGHDDTPGGGATFFLTLPTK